MLNPRMSRNISMVMVAAIMSATAIPKTAFGRGLQSDAERSRVSGSSKNKSLSVSIPVTNTSQRAIQAFISENPTAVDDAGNSYQVEIQYREFNGVWVCRQRSACLTDDTTREETETNATQIEPGESITITIGFSARGWDNIKIGEFASVGLVLHARDVIDEGKDFGPWKTVSLGVRNIPIRGM